jgi:hypothetical protein
LRKAANASQCCGGDAALFRSPIVILNPDDIVLAEVNSIVLFPGLLQPMDGTNRDIDRFVLVHHLNVVDHGDEGGASYDKPGEKTMVMLLLLKREPVTGLYDDALDLMAFATGPPRCRRSGLGR